MSQVPSNPAAADALRALIYQPGKDETLRNEADKVLLAWNAGWYVADLIKMMQDPVQESIPLTLPSPHRGEGNVSRQSALWRNYCVQHLWEHYSRYQDQASLDGLNLAARSRDYVIRSQAIFSLASIARDHDWKAQHPERLAELSAQLKGILAEASRLPFPVRSATLRGDPRQATANSRACGWTA